MTRAETGSGFVTPVDMASEYASDVILAGHGMERDAATPT